MMIGTALRYVLARRLSGATTAAACLIVPTIAVTGAVLLYPVVGLWDGATEGFLVGVGALLGGPRMYDHPRLIALTCVSVVAAFALLEVAARAFLGPPPAYPIG